MKKYRQVALMLAILTFVLTTGISTAYANPGEYEQSKRRSHLSEKRVLVLDAFDRGDFNAWKRVINDSKISNLFSVDVFDKFVKARKLARNGDYDKSFNLSREVGNDLHKIFAKINGGDDGYYLLEQVDKIVKEGEFDEIQ